MDDDPQQTASKMSKFIDWMMSDEPAVIPPLFSQITCTRLVEASDQGGAWRTKLDIPEPAWLRLRADETLETEPSSRFRGYPGLLSILSQNPE